MANFPMLGRLLWWCGLVSMYRPVPSPRDHYSASRGHESCRRHNIDMSFPHHFLPPPLLLCRTPWSKDGFQWLAWGYLLRDLSVFCIIMLYTLLLTLEVYIQFVLAQVWDTLLNIEVDSDCFIEPDNGSHFSCFNFAPVVFTDSNSDWILKTVV